MKKVTLLLVIFSISFFALNAQVTITSDNAPEIGDELTMYDVFDAEELLPGDAGANVTWDFSAEVETTLQTFGYIDPTGLPVVGNMNNPEIAEVINSQTNGYFYFGVEADDGDWMRHGFWGEDGGNEVWIAYDTPLKMYDYPFTYEDSYSVVDYTGGGEMAGLVTELGSTAYGYTCDAYGILILPHRIYPNATRIHITEEFSFMVDIGSGFMAVANVTDDSYYWFVEDVEGPVMTIITSETEDLIGGGTTTTKTARWYRSDPTEITTDFLVNLTSGDTYTDFIFANASYPIDGSTFAWEFTPGTVEYISGTSATDENPEVRFTEAGTYTVALTTTNGDFTPDAVTETKVDYIEVVAAPELVVDFTGDILNPANNGNTLFTPEITISDGSAVTGTTTYNWLVDGNGVDFWPVEGTDYNYVGGTTNTDENPRVQFLTTGCYRIQLIATNTDYSNSPVTFEKSNYISCAGGCGDAYDVTFTITDGSKGAIEGAEITVVGYSPITTNASGNATIALYDGDYDFGVTADGYEDWTGGVFTVNGLDVDVDLVTMVIAEINELNSNINIYPNPTNGTINIEGNSDSEVLITDITGKIVFSGVNITTVDLSNQNKGVYLIKIISRDKVETHKIILQ